MLTGGDFQSLRAENREAMFKACVMCKAITMLLTLAAEIWSKTETPLTLYCMDCLGNGEAAAAGDEQGMV